MQQDTLSVSSVEFQATAAKLDQFVMGLSSPEQAIMTWVFQRAGFAPYVPYQPRFRPHPRGAKHLVFGGADGLLVLFGRTGFHVIEPEGPLPTDFGSLSGAALIVRDEILGEV